MKESRIFCWNMEKRRHFPAILVYFILLYAVAVFLDIVPCLNAFVTTIKKSSIFDFNLQEKASTLVEVYGTVWTVSIGIIVFAIQRGYGRILGLHIGEILSILLSKRQIGMVVSYFLIKFMIYLLAYCYGWRCTLVLGLLESFLSLAYDIYFFIRISTLNLVSEILKENTKRNIKALCMDSIDSWRADWKIVKSAQNMNYDSSEECDALIEQVTTFLEAIEVPGECSEIGQVDFLIREMSILKQVTENICFADSGKKRMEYILKSCFENLTKFCGDSPGFRMFLLLESFLDISSSIITPEKIKKLFDILDEDNAAECLEALMIYIKFLQEEMAEEARGKLYLKECKNLYKNFLKKGTQEKREFAGGFQVVFLEYEKLKLAGKRTSDMNSKTQLTQIYNKFVQDIMKEEQG